MLFSWATLYLCHEEWGKGDKKEKYECGKQVTEPWAGVFRLGGASRSAWEGTITAFQMP
jgi:hypothetical protein